MAAYVDTNTLSDKSIRRQQTEDIVKKCLAKRVADPIAINMDWEAFKAAIPPRRNRLRNMTGAGYDPDN